MKILFAIFFAFIIANCSNPGYSIRISVNKAVNASENDLKLITNYLRDKPYETLLIKEKSFWKVESYKIILNEEAFNQCKHRYINFVLEYYYDHENENKLRLLDKIEIRIGNSWEGKNPIIKKEIDKAADYVINQLNKSFDLSNIVIERRYTGPV